MLGHPFYFETLKSFHKITSKLPQSLENTLSIPIWFNKHLKTKFDVEISKAGFNFVKDLYPENRRLTLNEPDLSPSKVRKLQRIIDIVPPLWENCIVNSAVKCTVVSPRQTVSLNENDYFVQHMGSDKMYSILVSKVVKTPTGVLRWRSEFDMVLSEQQLKTSLTFAKGCGCPIFDQVFQYKIVCQILPTQKYLNRYLVADSDLCTKCLVFQDTVYHRLWHCGRLTLHLAACFEFLKTECNLLDQITCEKYLFGFEGIKREGINHILLELKKLLFYEWSSEVGGIAFCERFRSKIKSVIIKEKVIAQTNDSFPAFNEKWDTFTAFYDFRGPDMQIYS